VRHEHIVVNLQEPIVLVSRRVLGNRFGLAAEGRIIVRHSQAMPCEDFEVETQWEALRPGVFDEAPAFGILWGVAGFERD